MGGFGYFIGGVMPYIAIVVLVVGLGYKMWRWLTAPLHLKWGIYPYPETETKKLKEMLTEILTLQSLFRHNRKVWYGSCLFHWGLYLLFFWIVLTILGLLSGYAHYIGWIGGLLALAGILYLIGLRSLDSEIKANTTAVEYFNLFLLLGIVAMGLYVSVSGLGFSAREYLASLASFRSVVPQSPIILANLLLIEIFMIYLPFSKMSHFLAKYFTYHKVKWGE